MKLHERNGNDFLWIQETLRVANITVVRKTRYLPGYHSNIRTTSNGDRVIESRHDRDRRKLCRAKTKITNLSTQTRRGHTMMPCHAYGTISMHFYGLA
jgi:hypothetical protein